MPWYRYKYAVPVLTLKTLLILQRHPGIQARTFAGLMWPHLHAGGPQPPPLLASEHLRLLKKKGMVRIKYTCDPFKGPAKCIYYLSAYGHEICDYFSRNP
jgi:hypothetical protein